MQTDQITAALDAANIRYTKEAIAMLAECNAEPDWEQYREARAAFYDVDGGRPYPATRGLIAAHPHMPETKAMQARIAELEAAINEHPHAYKPDPDGWIDWRGGAIPVDRNAEVVASYREGTCSRVQLAHAFNWAHDNGGLDIIAYRVLP